MYTQKGRGWRRERRRKKNNNKNERVGLGEVERRKEERKEDVGPAVLGTHLFKAQPSKSPAPQPHIYHGGKSAQKVVAAAR